MIKRKLTPGDECLYIKIYGSILGCENALLNKLYPFSYKLINSKIINKWFFIRYSDDDGYHLRLRFFFNDVNQIGNTIIKLSRLIKTDIVNKEIHKFQIDTYNRELERYGEKYIELTEKIFFYDSICCCEILRKEHSFESRWKIFVYLTDSLLSVLSYSLTEKQYLMANLSDSYKKEFGFNKFNSKSLNVINRKYKQCITDIIEQSFNSQISTNIYDLITNRNDNIKLLCAKISPKSLNIKSIIHMTTVRIFPNKNRINEVVIYTLLNRYYISKLARLKNNKSK